MASFAKYQPPSEPPGDVVAEIAHSAAFRPALVRFFRRKVREVDDVEDLVQDVFVRIAGRHGEAVANMGGYVFQTAATVVADRYRRRSARRADDHVPFDCELHSGTDFDAGRVMESRQALRIVEAALMDLPERTRAIFLMRRLEGQNYKDIAVAFGISVSAVEKHMTRAAEKLAPARHAATDFQKPSLPPTLLKPMSDRMPGAKRAQG